MGSRRPRFAALAAVGLVACVSTGCFQSFEEYRQTTPAARPSDAQPVSPRPDARYFPLAVGAHYEYAAHFGLGAAGPFSGTASLSVTDAWRSGGLDTYEAKVVSRYFGRTRADTYRFVLDADRIGLVEHVPPDVVRWFLPLRLAVGDRWAVETGEGTGEAVVEAIERVRLGTLVDADCARVRYVNPGAATDMTLWFGPGIGLVQAQIAIQAGGLPLRGRLQLEAYQPPLRPAR